MYEDKKCKLITCPIFHKPAHSFMINVAYTYNSVIHFSCLSGYFLRGNNSIQCQETKQWSSPSPVCETIKCLPPHPPKHGSANNTNEVEINETVSFSCLKPYNLKGESVLTCLQDGSWNFPTPVCTLSCFVPEIAGRVVTISEGIILKPRTTLINEGGKKRPEQQRRQPRWQQYERTHKLRKIQEQYQNEGQGQQQQQQKRKRRRGENQQTKYH
uniref:Sushi domain-containing protein n=1 Tax=Octopus bimaculoides TaxID=37653 RepID=A0A0L8GPB1_OCTBM